MSGLSYNAAEAALNWEAGNAPIAGRPLPVGHHHRQRRPDAKSLGALGPSGSELANFDNGMGLTVRVLFAELIFLRARRP
jgi:hypothetical protein